MIADDSKPYLPFLNKLADQYNNTYHHYINRKTSNADCSALTEKTDTKLKAPKFKVNDGIRISKSKSSRSKCHTEIWSKEILIIDSVLKINPSAYKIKDLNEEKIIGNFH